MNRDLTADERNTLEALIDAANLGAVVCALSEICDAKAEHIREAWQDEPIARQWDDGCGVLGLAFTKLPTQLSR